MPSKLATISGALLAVSLLAGCGEEQGSQNSSQSLDGAAEQPSQALGATTMEGRTDDAAQEATGEQPTQ